MFHRVVSSLSTLPYSVSCCQLSYTVRIHGVFVFIGIGLRPMRCFCGLWPRSLPQSASPTAPSSEGTRAARVLSARYYLHDAYGIVSSEGTSCGHRRLPDLAHPARTPHSCSYSPEIPRLFRCDAGFLPVGLSVGLTGMFQRTALTSASVRYLPAAITSGA